MELHRARLTDAGPPDVGDERSGVRHDALLQVGIQKEVDPVADDRAGPRAAELPAREVAPPSSQTTRRQPPVLEETERRAVEGIRSRLRNGIEEPAREVAEADVERRGEHLKLADRLQRDRMGQHLGEKAARERATGGSPALTPPSTWRLLKL